MNEKMKGRTYIREIEKLRVRESGKRKKLRTGEKKDRDSET